MTIPGHPGNHGVRASQTNIPSSLNHALVVLRRQGRDCEIDLKPLLREEALFLRDNKWRQRVVTDNLNLPIKTASILIFDAVPKQFGRMLRLPLRQVLDLLAAGNSRRDNFDIGGCRFDGRCQAAVADLD